MNEVRTQEPDRLARSRDLWRLTAVGMICLVAGAMLVAASHRGPSDSAHVGQDSPNKSTDGFVAVILDPNKGSGRWASTLLAVKGDGEIFYLDTTRPNTNWAPYMYSPGFNARR